jgi:Dockerin type I domain/Bacterial Ig domain
MAQSARSILCRGWHPATAKRFSGHSPARYRRLLIEQFETRSLLATVTLTPTADNTIFEEAPQNSNGAGQYLFAGQAFTAAGIRRALLRFDVASAIPAGSRIDSATLELHVSKIKPFEVGPHEYGVHRVLAAWGEGSSNAAGEEGTGAAASPSDATWSHRLFNQTVWSSAGGDFAASPSATAAVGGIASYQWTGNLAFDVQAWLNAPASQFGWLVKEVDETAEGTAKRFDSKENPSPSFRPRLTVEYSLVNLAPTLNPIADPAPVQEDALLQTLNLSGISAGGNETQSLRVTVDSSNPSLIPPPSISYTSPAATGSLSYTPVANQSGTSSITVTVRDAGLDGIIDNDDDATTSRTFNIRVTAVNDPPTLNAIATPAAILEDAGQQTINLSGISTGGGEIQTLVVRAVSSIPGLIPNPTVIYTSANSTGSLRYTPVANESGTATITVTVRDAGLDGLLDNADDGVVSQSFTVRVNPVNDPPTIDALSNPPAIQENAGEQTVNLTGISAGPLEAQTLVVRAVSNNTGLIPNPAVTYASAAASGSLAYTPAANQNGSAVITVTVRDAGLDGILDNADDGTLATQFTVLVNSAVAINQAPSFTKGPNKSAIDEDGALSFAGWATAISPGPAGEELQTVDFLVESDAANLFVVQPQIDRAGTLTFRPAPNLRGTAHLTVRLKDNGGTANGGVDTSQPQTFDITITKPHVWFNARNGLDVTGDGHVVAGDALAVINYINAFTAGPVPPSAPIGPNFCDVNKDNSVAPNDALAVINAINAGLSGGEGEATQIAPLAADQVFQTLELAKRPEFDKVADSLAALLGSDNTAARRQRRRAL